MKKSVFIVLFILAAIFLHAQNQLTYTEEFDRIFQNISRADATTRILYDRVVPFSQLLDFDIAAAHSDTSNYAHFRQRYSELYRAAFSPAARLPQTYELSTRLADSLAALGVVYIGTLHYRLNVMDSVVGKQKLSLGPDSLLMENSNVTASLYTEKEILIMTPLTEKITGGNIVFRFDPQFFFDNTNYGNHNCRL
jgi:hypothetical protein